MLLTLLFGVVMTRLSSDKASAFAIDLLLRLKSLDEEAQDVRDARPRPGNGPQVWASNFISGVLPTKYKSYEWLQRKRRVTVLNSLASRWQEAEAMLTRLLDQELKAIDSGYALLCSTHLAGKYAADTLGKLGDAYTSTLIVIAAAKHHRQRVTRSSEPLIIGEIRGQVSELRWRATAYAGAMDIFCDSTLVRDRFPELQPAQLGVKPGEGIACMADLDKLQIDLRLIKRNVNHEEQRLGRVVKTLREERLAQQNRLRQELWAPFAC